MSLKQGQKSFYATDRNILLFHPVCRKPVNTNKSKIKDTSTKIMENILSTDFYILQYIWMFLQENLDCRPKNYKKVGTVVGVQGIKNEDLNLDWRETRKRIKIENWNGY